MSNKVSWKLKLTTFKSFAQNVGPAVLNFLRNNGYCGTKTINDGIQTKLNRHFTSFDIPVSDIRMSIFYRNITCQRHPPVIELFLLFGTVNQYFWQPKALIGVFFSSFMSPVPLVTRKRISLSAITTNPGFPQLYPKIYSLFFGFLTSCGLHEEIFIHTSEFGSSPCLFVRLVA